MYKQQKKEQQKFVKMNLNIRVPEVRVVQDGKQLGVMPTDKARKLAFESGLDLVEIVPAAKPPVCSIIDYAKFRYEQKQREKQQRKNQRHVELKEIRLRPNIQENDINTKIGAIKKFLSEGKRVQINLSFKSREIVHKEEGFRVMRKIIENTGDVSKVERAPSMEGNRMICRLEPKEIS